MVRREQKSVNNYERGNYRLIEGEGRKGQINQDERLEEEEEEVWGA